MIVLKGIYDGQVVSLEYPVKVDHEVPVIVNFPDNVTHPEPTGTAHRQWRWQEVGDLPDGCNVSVTEILLQERNEERS